MFKSDTILAKNGRILPDQETLGIDPEASTTKAKSIFNVLNKHRNKWYPQRVLGVQYTVLALAIGLVRTEKRNMMFA
jgi:hypothetical protein